MFFLTLSGADVDFLDRELRWKTYTIQEALPTTKRVELVGKKEFATAALDPEHETYVVHVGSVSSVALPSSSLLNVHPIAGLIAEKASTSRKYSLRTWRPNSPSTLGSMIMLLSWLMINNHHSLRPVELETLKAYIETNLAHRFIRPSKSPAGAPIFFDRRSDRSPWLCVWGFNNLTIKNR